MSESMVPDTGARAVDLFIRWSNNELDEVRRDFDTKGIGESGVRVRADFTVVDVQLQFEDGPMMGRVAYDSDGRIAGLSSSSLALPERIADACARSRGLTLCLLEVLPVRLRTSRGITTVP